MSRAVFLFDLKLFVSWFIIIDVTNQQAASTISTFNDFSNSKFCYWNASASGNNHNTWENLSNVTVFLHRRTSSSTDSHERIERIVVWTTTRIERQRMTCALLSRQKQKTKKHCQFVRHCVFDQSTRIAMYTVSDILHNKMDSHAPKFNYIFGTSMSNYIWFDVAIVFTQAADLWIRITWCKKTQNYIRINNKVAIYSSYT